MMAFIHSRVKGTTQSGSVWHLVAIYAVYRTIESILHPCTTKKFPPTDRSSIKDGFQFSPWQRTRFIAASNPGSARSIISSLAVMDILK